MKTKHHIIPRSRGGNNGKGNILLVEDNKHRAYHLLFANKLQHEIIEYLIEEWFNGKLTLKTQELFLNLLKKELKRKTYKRRRKR